MISCPEKESFCWHGDANKSTLFQDTTVVVHIGKVAKSSLLLQKNHFFYPNIQYALVYPILMEKLLTQRG